MATINCTVQRSSWYEVYFEYSYTQDKATAKTALSHSLKLKQITDSYDFDTVGEVTVSYIVAGQTFSKKGRINIDDKGDKGYTITLASGSSTITHDASTGVGSFTVSVDTSIDSAGYGPGTIKLSSKKVDLPTIYRASKPTVSPSSVQMGSTLTITTNCKSSSFTHTLQYTFGGSTATIATGVGASYAWVVPDLASKCNNATSGTATITCITYNGSTTVGTETCTVTLTVPNASTPSFSASSVALGGVVSVYTNRLSSNFTHYLELVFEGEKINDASNITTYKKFSLPLTLASKIPSKPSGTVTAKCTTYNGTAKVGSTISKTFTVTVPNNTTTQPIASFTLTPTGSLPSAFSGMYIQGKTGVKADFTASSAYSTISSYKMTVDGKTHNGDPAVSGAVTKSGDITVTGSVTDARGYANTSLSQKITVHPYRVPSIEPHSNSSKIICERSLQNGTYDDAGTYLHIKCSRSYAEVGGKNTCTLQYKCKMQNGGWSSPVTLLSGTDTENDYEGILPDVVSQADKSYTIKLIVKDAISPEETYDYSIPTKDVTMHLGKDGYGVAFGKFSEATEDNKMVEVSDDWELVVLGDRWKSLGVSTSVPASSESNLGRAEKDDCCYRVENGNHVYVAFNCGLEWENNVVQVNNDSIPSKYRPKNTVYSFCVCNGRYIAKVGVTKAGAVYIASLQDASAGTPTLSATVGWVDGYIDYFI